MRFDDFFCGFLLFVLDGRGGEGVAGIVDGPRLSLALFGLELGEEAFPAYFFGTSLVPVQRSHRLILPTILLHQRIQLRLLNGHQLLLHNLFLVRAKINLVRPRLLHHVGDVGGCLQGGVHFGTLVRNGKINDVNGIVLFVHFGISLLLFARPFAALVGCSLLLRHCAIILRILLLHPLPLLRTKRLLRNKIGIHLLQYILQRLLRVLHAARQHLLRIPLHHAARIAPLGLLPLLALDQFGLRVHHLLGVGGVDNGLGDDGSVLFEPVDGDAEAFARQAELFGFGAGFFEEAADGLDVGAGVV
mmetsp:Transcript_7160/g.15791  ORF Transcript_7160/g.15791 Transcript_7160/m.15791 type:complete len:303 (+) Transcript_7160:3028-3936(+)